MEIKLIFITIKNIYLLTKWQMINCKKIRSVNNLNFVTKKFNFKTAYNVDALFLM